MTILELILGIGGAVALIALVSLWIIKVNELVRQLDLDMDIDESNHVIY